MKGSYAKDSIAVITSVGPEKLPEQRAAVESWKAISNEVISLNHPDDRGYTGQIRDFCRVIETDLSARDVVGKPLIRIDAFLELFRRSRADLLIIANADIHLVQPERLIDIIAQAECNLLLGNRLDVETLASADGELYKWGFDYLCIDRHAAAAIPASMFAMGAPWWDIWVPMMAILNGARAARCTAPVARHVIHPQRWSMKWHAWYALHLTEFVCEFVTANLETQHISQAQQAVLADILVPYMLARRHRALQLANGAHQTNLQDEAEWELYEDFAQAFNLFIARQAPAINDTPQNS